MAELGFFLGLLAAAGNVAGAAESEPPFAWVDLKIKISAQGRAEEVVVLGAVPDYRYESTATSVAMSAEFPIKTEAGQAVPYVGTQRIEFPRLEPETHAHKLGQADLLIRSCRYDYATRVLQSAPAAESAAERHEEAARQVEIELIAGNFDSALNKIDGLLAQLEPNSELYFDLINQKIWTLIRLGQAESAEAVSAEYLEKVPVPGTWETQYLRVIALAELDRRDEAVDLLARYRGTETTEAAARFVWPKFRPGRQSRIADGDRSDELMAALRNPALRVATPWLAIAYGNLEPNKVLQTAGIRPMVSVAPKYPRNALRRNQEGWVLVQLDVDERGRVAEAKVVESEPAKVFDDAALTALRQWQFQPQMENCRPVVHSGYMPLYFSIN